MSQFAFAGRRRSGRRGATEVPAGCLARFNQARDSWRPATREAADHFLAAAGFFHTIGDQEDIALSNQRASDAFAAMDRQAGSP